MNPLKPYSSTFSAKTAGALASCLLPALALSAQAKTAVAPVAKPQAARPNVLFIAVDDLRPSIGCYGDTLAKTPSIDGLAASGTTFLRAYCQQAVCSPSRTSLMTGLRPDTTRIYDLRTHFRNTIPQAVTLTQYFKGKGYFTQSMGKIYHPGLDDEASWSVPSWQSKGPSYGPEGEAAAKRHAAEAIAAARARGRDPKLPPPRANGPAWEGSADVPDNYFRDGLTADHAIETLRERKANPTQPFFLALGMAKPHLPFVSPKKYWDLFQDSDFQLPSNYRFAPQDVPPIALQNSGELRSYDGIPAAPAPLSDEQAIKMLHGYYAATSYMDAQLGRVLAELDRLKLRQNTIVVLWSDHGYHLGEHTMWNKHTNFEIAARVPLIVSVPGQKPGAKVNQLAELVDVYPTLCEAAGLPVPAGLAGKSLLPVVRNAKAPSKPAAFSQYPRGPMDADMGYSIRTDNFRYTEWIERATGKLLATELYDHRNDDAENTNVAARPQNAALVSRLSAMLRPIRDAGFEADQKAARNAPTPAAAAGAD